MVENEDQRYVTRELLTWKGRSQHIYSQIAVQDPFNSRRVRTVSEWGGEGMPSCLYTSMCLDDVHQRLEVLRFKGFGFIVRHVLCCQSVLMSVRSKHLPY